MASRKLSAKRRKLIALGGLCAAAPSVILALHHNGDHTDTFAGLGAGLLAGLALLIWEKRSGKAALSR